MLRSVQEGDGGGVISWLWKDQAVVEAEAVDGLCCRNNLDVDCYGTTPYSMTTS